MTAQILAIHSARLLEILVTDSGGNPIPGVTVTSSSGTNYPVNALRPVTIIIKPGDTSPAINTENRGNIPVAILSTAQFNAATEINQSSLTFASTGSELSLVGCNAEDVNRDGVPDLVCNFATQDTALQPGDPGATLKGETRAGLSIMGMARATVF
jgi:hypothetical protein